MALDRPNENENRKHKSISRRKALSHLTRSELVKRRFSQLTLLSKYYRALYWILMEHLKSLYKHYIWKFKEPTSVANDNSSFPTCAFFGCVRKPMPLTTFCYFHILFDPRQHLYKPCEYVFTRAQAGLVTCAKPILRSTVPSLCNVHMQEANMHLSRALKEAGANVSSTGDYTPPKFHLLVAEFVRQIQAKRREMRGNRSQFGSQIKMITEQ